MSMIVFWLHSHTSIVQVHIHVKSTCTYKAVFILAHGHGSGAGPPLYTHVAQTCKIQDPGPRGTALPIVPMRMDPGSSKRT